MIGGVTRWTRSQRRLGTRWMGSHNSSRATPNSSHGAGDRSVMTPVVLITKQLSPVFLLFPSKTKKLCVVRTVQEIQQGQ